MVSAPRKNILIAGCGDVGCRLGLRLVGEGHTVWGLRRRPEALPAELRPLAADLSDPETLRDLPPALDVVVYTTAADGHADEAYRRAYVTGVDHLLNVLEARPDPPKRFLFASSTGVYGQTDGSWVDESSPVEPRSFTGRRVLEGEERCRAGTIPSVSLRLGGIYGPGRTRLIERVASGAATCPAGEPVFTNRIHSDDAAGALAHLTALADPEPVYLGVDAEPADLCEVSRFLARRLGVAPPETVPRDPSYRRGGSKRCSSRRLQSSGFSFRYPTYREGYAALISELRPGTG